MKQLVVLRHAKTERNHPNGDRSRRLTERGENDAAAAGRRVLEAAGMPDAIVSSDAVRAVQTAAIVAKSIGFEGDIIKEPDIYLASLSDLIAVVHSLPDEAATIVMIGHNPGFLELINWFAGEDERQDDLPTAAFAGVSSAVQSWVELEPDTASVSPVIAP